MVAKNGIMIQKGAMSIVPFNLHIYVSLMKMNLDYGGVVSCTLLIDNRLLSNIQIKNRNSEK